jgi:predicted metal-binding membrane protein
VSVQRAVSRTPADTPRGAMSLLHPRATLTTIAALLALATIAWLLTVRQTGEMQMTMSLQAPLFMAMWLTMMVAMMFPTIVPMVLAHRMVVLRRGEGLVATGAFVLGYLVIWTLVGLLPLGALLIFRQLIQSSEGARWPAMAAGAVLVVAGLYQFTSWKSACLKACRTPLDFILSHDFGSGAPGAFRAGLSHGLYCLGCCWALMAVLLLIGFMQLGWMAAIAAVFLLEKTWRHGVGLTMVVGTALVILGIAVVVRPDLLPLLPGGFLPPRGGRHM